MITVDLNFPVIDGHGKEIEKGHETLFKNLKGEGDPKHPREKFNEIADSITDGKISLSYADWKIVREWWSKLPMPAFAYAPVLRAMEEAKDESVRLDKEAKASKKLEESK